MGNDPRHIAARIRGPGPFAIRYLADRYSQHDSTFSGSTLQSDVRRIGSNYAAMLEALRAIVATDAAPDGTYTATDIRDIARAALAQLEG